MGFFGTYKTLTGIVLGVIVYELYSRKMGHPGPGMPGSGY